MVSNDPICKRIMFFYRDVYVVAGVVFLLTGFGRKW